MTVPSLGGYTTETRIRLDDQPDGPYLRVVFGLIPSPVWHRLCDMARDDAGTIGYDNHAASFIAAGVTRIGDHLNEPVPLDPGDADTIANSYPPHIVTRILVHIIRANTSGWSDPKD